MKLKDFWDSIPKIDLPNMDIFVIIAIIFFVVFVINVLGQKHIRNNTLIAFTGAPGQLKSFLMVKNAIKHYKKINFLIFLQKILPFKIIEYDKEHPPLLISNIPIYIGRKYWLFGAKKWATVLQYEHLILEARIPPQSTIAFDELGDVASQFDYDSPFVMQFLQELVRFIRHYLLGSGKFIVTDQSSMNFAVQIKRRIGQVFNLINFRRWWIFFYKVEVNEVMVFEDMMTVEQTTEVGSRDYFFGLLPFKYLTWLNKILLYKKHYDSLCYSENYKAEYKEETTYTEYKKRDFISLPNTADMRKQYKRDGFIPRKDMAKYLILWKKAIALEDTSEASLIARIEKPLTEEEILFREEIRKGFK